MVYLKRCRSIFLKGVRKTTEVVSQGSGPPGR